MPEPKNKLFYGDNLEILRKHIGNESVDLIYLDPPFNSNRSYNVLFKNKSGDDAQAQLEAFDDTWSWSQQTEAQFDEIVQGGHTPARVVDAVIAMRGLLGDNDVLAYLVMMTARLTEMHRVLKPNGSIYLHCDPTASHYLKVVLDALFLPTNFRSEIIWKRHSSHNDAKTTYGAVHDVILFYGKSQLTAFNPQYADHDPAYVAKAYRNADPDGRRFQIQNLASPNPRPNLTYAYTALNGVTYQPHPNGWKYTPERMAQLDAEHRLYYPAKDDGRLRLKNYIDEMKGSVVPDVWTDVGSLSGSHAERLGYPTQKPLALLERIIAASSNPGDVVLDPFCGCGTAVDAAQKLGRRWLGIDISTLAVDLIRTRLRDVYGAEISETFEVRGLPHDIDGARQLFSLNAFEFERWVVGLVDAQANEKQVGDKGIDGVIRFPLDKTSVGRALVSVKGGTSLNPGMVRDLRGTIETQKAEMGIFLCLAEPTKGMVEEANQSGSYTYDLTGTTYPRIQILTVKQLLSGMRPHMPNHFPPYVKAPKRLIDDNQLSMFGADEGA